ncbi:MAG: transglycosylase SLT domain-containing protein [Oscillospiraceae bacterium]|nr:transglycosylase SLT domain-containing protein [Oscillospiraceae bacterium]
MTVGAPFLFCLAAVVLLGAAAFILLSCGFSLRRLAQRKYYGRVQAANRRLSELALQVLLLKRALPSGLLQEIRAGMAIQFHVQAQELFSPAETRGMLVYHLAGTAALPVRTRKELLGFLNAEPVVSTDGWELCARTRAVLAAQRHRELSAVSLFLAAVLGSLALLWGAVSLALPKAEAKTPVAQAAEQDGRADRESLILQWTLPPERKQVFDPGLEGRVYLPDQTDGTAKTEKSAKSKEDRAVVAAKTALTELDPQGALPEEETLPRSLSEEIQQEEEPTPDGSTAVPSAQPDGQLPSSVQEAHALPQPEETWYYEIPLSHDLQDYTRKLCKACDFPVEWALTTMYMESRYTPDAVSSTKDHGIMQINEVNHGWMSKQYGVDDFYDPEQNILCGVRLMSEFYHKYGDVRMAIMAYGHGEAGAKEKYWDSGVYTTNYAERAVRIMEQLRTMRTISERG